MTKFDLKYWWINSEYMTEMVEADSLEEAVEKLKSHLDCEVYRVNDELTTTDGYCFYEIDHEECCEESEDEYEIVLEYNEEDNNDNDQ